MTKSVRFISRPSVEQLRRQVELVAGCLTHLLHHASDLDLHMTVALDPDAPVPPVPVSSAPGDQVDDDDGLVPFSSQAMERYLEREAKNVHHSELEDSNGPSQTEQQMEHGNIQEDNVEDDDDKKPKTPAAADSMHWLDDCRHCRSDGSRFWQEERGESAVVSPTCEDDDHRTPTLFDDDPDHVPDAAPTSDFEYVYAHDVVVVR